MPTLNDSSHVQLFVTACTVSHQALLSMGFFRQEYYSGLPFPSPSDLPNLGIEPASPVTPSLAGRFFTTKSSGNCLHYVHTFPSGSLTWRVKKIFIDQNDTNCLFTVHWPWLHVHTRSLGNIIMLETRMERRRAWAGALQPLPYMQESCNDLDINTTASLLT